jgi:6-phosphogluconolactonase
LRLLSKSVIQVEIYRDPDDLAANAAGLFAKLALQAVAETGRFTVALSGGTTPRTIFSLLAAEPFSREVPWRSIYFFWVDERWVPPDHPDSNYRLAAQTLLDRVGVPAENIFRIPSELSEPNRAAESYSATLRECLMRSDGSAESGSHSNRPRLDLVLLGMGADGHTASLFPNTAAVNAKAEIAVSNYVDKLNSYRITLTAPTINNARNIAFIVSGEEKAEALKNVLEGDCLPQLYPSQLIRPGNGMLSWMVDEAAAKLLEDPEGHPAV